MLIGGTPGYQIVGAFASVETAAGSTVWTDVVLLDIGLPGMSGVEGVAHLKARFPSVYILMLTVYSDDEHIFDAICAGASGYLLKDTPPAGLLDAIREVARARRRPTSPTRS